MNKQKAFANTLQDLTQTIGQLWPEREETMKKIAKHLIPNFGTLAILGLFFLAQTVGARPSGSPQSQGPSATMISYQGRLTDADGVPLSGDYQMGFALYDVPTGGSPCWEETQTVTVSDGLFNVLLGSTNSIDHSCLTGDVYLGIKVGDDFEMTPRELLTSVPYAVHAGIQDGAVTTAKLADGAVTTAKLNLVDGNVGIGTADPGEKLVVARTDFAGFNPANVAAELISNKHSFLKLTPGGVGMDSWGIFAGGDNDRLGIYSYGGQAERVSVLESGNVGIGTTEPGAKLSIADSGTAAGAMFLQIGDDSFLTDVDAQNTLGLYGSQDSTTASIRLGSNGGTISGNNGNVGIGTTSPDSKLNVNGSLHVEGGGFGGTPLGEFGTFIDVDAANWNRIELRGSSGAYIDFSNDTTSDYDVRLILAGDDALAIEGGNVGIGTTSPQHKLDVEGTIQAKDVFAAGGKNLIVGDDTYLTDIDTANTLGIYGMLNSDRAGIRLGSDGSLIFGDNGNIGIGTTSPSDKLHVNGDIRVHNAHCGALVETNLQTEDELAAERVDRFERGDVLCWGDGKLEKCSIPNDSLVQAVADENGKPIVIGAEVVRVLGPVHRGDLLVASSVPGYAMVNNDPTPGTVIAQALEDFEGEKGIIKAMIRKF